MKHLSIIIVTYHSEEDIYDCLDSLWQHCDIPQQNVEVILVDNSPECEPMFSKLRQLYGEKLILIHNTHNGGYGHGNNVGIRHATAPVILIMNPDVRLCEPVFAAALAAFEKDEELCMYGMKQFLSDSVKSPLSFDCSIRMNGYLAPILSSLCNRWDCFLSQWMFLSGSFFFIRKQMFEQVGLFDEDIFMYGEEDDIHWRLKQRFGAHFVYNPRFRYIHRTLDRPMNLETERKMLQAFVLSNKKKGISADRTLRNRKRFYRVRYVSALCKKLLGRENKEHLKIIKAMLNEIG